MKKNITIGIPAHNEGKNIASLLNSILKQKETLFTLKHIIVACDGCTDNTISEVRKFKDKRIKLINDGKRLGQRGRLNQLFKICTTEIFVTLDADTQLAHENSLNELVKPFSNGKIGLVGGCNIPLEAKSVVGKAVIAYEKFWRLVTSKINNGDNIHNCPGCVWAAKRQFLKKLQIPDDVVASDHYIYLKAVELKYKFKFAKKGVVYFKLPSNLADYLSQTTRFLESKNDLTSHFNQKTLNVYKIPRRTKIVAYLKSLATNPFYMTVGIFLQILLKISITTRASSQTSTYWSPVKSSK